MKLDEEMPNPIYFDLKPNRHLLDPNFDGYKLSLDKLPIYTVPFPHGVDRVGPGEEQYSIQHTKLFGLHNSLNGDPYNVHVAFVVDKGWAVRRIQLNPETAVFSELTEVLAIPTTSTRGTGRFNVNISFPSDNLAVIGDGFSSFFICETGDRGSEVAEPWKIVHEEHQVQEQNLEDLGQFLVLDSTAYQENDSACLDVLLLRVRERNETAVSEFLNKNEDQFLDMCTKHPFVSKLNWISFKKVNDKWLHNCTRTLLGPSGIDYASIESKGTGILIASENHFAFYHISNEPLRYKERSKQKKVESSKPDYVWMQNGNEITVLFKLPIGASKSDIHLTAKPSSLLVEYLGKPMLEGELQHSIKADEMVWTITPMSATDEESQEDGDVISSGDATPAPTQYQSLEIIVQKVSEEEKWEGDSIIKGPSNGQQVLDPELVANIQERLSHLCSDKWNEDPMRSKVCDPQELEECDGFPADTTCFMRIDRDLQYISHIASLGAHQWLFSTRMNDALIPALCIRHDVDGIVWQPQEFDKDNFKAWRLEHYATFSAFGYVQASKQQRRFTICSPDSSFVAICDTKKHIYIYKQPNAIDTDLRNRKTGRIVSHVSKQHVVPLEPPAEVMGAWATNDFLFVLTSENIHSIRVKEPAEQV